MNEIINDNISPENNAVRRLIKLVPTQESMFDAQAFTEEALDAAGVNMKIAVKINIAVDEIYSNIILYSGATEAEIELVTLENEVKLIFRDNGTPYDPLSKEDPDITLSAEEREIGGLGVFMVKEAMDNEEYRFEDGRNVLTLTMKL